MKGYILILVLTIHNLEIAISSIYHLKSSKMHQPLFKKHHSIYQIIMMKLILVSIIIMPFLIKLP